MSSSEWLPWTTSWAESHAPPFAALEEPWSSLFVTFIRWFRWYLPSFGFCPT